MVRFTAIIFIIFSMVVPAGLRAEAEIIPQSHDMQELGRTARALNAPILIEFALAHCEYCKRLEIDYLNAMIGHRDYESKLVIRKMIIDGELTLRDFSGEKIDVAAFVKRYRVAVTPTLVFLDSNGQEIGKRLVGYQDTGFFGGQLENAIELAQAAVRRK